MVLKILTRNRKQIMTGIVEDMKNPHIPQVGIQKKSRLRVKVDES